MAKRSRAKRRHVYLALAHANRGQLAAAITEVNRAISIDPANRRLAVNCHSKEA